MGRYIAAAQANIRGIVESIVASEQADVRFALIEYRDHPPEDRTFITRTHAFTSSRREMQAYVDGMQAKGGGDGPEAVADAYHEAVFLPWRKEATKIALHIADAPPHGLEPHGDRHPPGWDTHDPIEMANAMARSGITCYTIGCEPALGHYQRARDFMCAVADITGGQAVPLASADRLAAVILGGAREEIGLERLMQDVERDMEESRAEVLSEALAAHAAAAAAAGESADSEEWRSCAPREASQEAVAARVHSKMSKRRVQSVQMMNAGAMSSENVHHFRNAATLGACRSELDKCSPAAPPNSMMSDWGTRKKSMRKSRSKAAAPRDGAFKAATMDVDDGDFHFGSMPCGRYAAMGGLAAAAAAPTSAAAFDAAGSAPVECVRSDISMEQVTRLCMKSAARSKAMSMD